MFWLRRWLPEVRRDHAAVALVSKRERHIGRVLAWGATVWLFGVVCWGLFGRHLAGHYASSASVGIIADNMLKWRIAGPVWRYTASPPALSEYYCHHPWGIFWTQAGFTALLGRHDYVARLPPIIASVATVPLIYQLASALWRPLAGGVAACAFVVLPITLSFGHFNALEVPVMAWSTLGLWGYVRYRQCGKRRYFAASIGGMFMAMNSDWPAFMLMALLLGTQLVAQIFGSANTAEQRRMWRWWLTSAAVALVTGAGYLLLFQRSGKLADLLQSYDLRSAGQSKPLAAVLESRRYWIELMFTPAAVVLGKLAAILLLARSLILRRLEPALLVLTMAVAQYVVFKQGADIHIFWPQYFALYFALAMGALVATSMAALTKLHRPVTWATAWLLPLALVGRDGVEVADWARASGGRLNERGYFIQSDGDKTALLALLAAQVPSDARVDLHLSMHATWSQVWTLGGRVVNARARKPRGAMFVADARYVPPTTLKRWLRKHPVQTAGHYWWIDPSADAGAGFEMQPRPRSSWQRYLFGSHEPQWTLQADPFHTWELRHHFGLAAKSPGQTPATLQQKRVAHNIALSAGESAHADRLRSEVTAAFEALDVRYPAGPRLIGRRFEPGERPTLTLLFEARTLRDGLRPSLRSRVVAPPAWSTTMADPTIREVGAPPALEPSRWRPGLLYSYQSVIRKRPGEEVFELYWRYGSGPRPATPSLGDDRGRRVLQVLRLGP